jgi:hypothetical protein
LIGNTPDCERRKIVEDQDQKTPEEEADVEGHLKDPDFSDPEFTKRDDDDVEAHALRDPDFADPDFARKDEEKDPDFS